MASQRRSPQAAIAVVVLAAAIILPLLLQVGASRKKVVVYCAHDSVFADSVIRRFETLTGIDVLVRYDEEANKSLGLTNLLISEKSSPRCDVFWNNQTLGTIRLKSEGVLAPCDANLLARIPPAFRDPDNHWAGFAARLRVYIVNTSTMEASDEAIASALSAQSLSRVAIAVPLFGTTLSHYCVLADQTGIEALRQWHTSLHQRGIREVRGNGAVKELVAEGACDLGFTDTDDFFAAKDAGKPVAMRPVRLQSGKTICVPNSVAMIRNCPHPQEAAQLIQYLLSEDVEVALAQSSSRQIPLGPVDKARLPDEVQKLSEWAAESVAMEGAAAQQDRVLNWLATDYAGP